MTTQHDDDAPADYIEVILLNEFESEIMRAINAVIAAGGKLNKSQIARDMGCGVGKVRKAIEHSQTPVRIKLYPKTVHPKIEPHWGYSVFGSDNLLQLANWVAYGKSTEFIEAWVKATLGVDNLPNNFHADLAELVKQGEWVREEYARDARLS